MSAKFELIDVDEVKCHPVIPGHNPRLVELDEPCHIVFKRDGLTVKIVAPEGFVWDQASIPYTAISIIRVLPGGAMNLASLWHDGGYRTKGFRKTHGQHGIPEFELPDGYTMSRKDVDLLFRDLMCYTTSYNQFQIAACYAAVRLAGRRFYGGDAPKF